MGKVRDDAAAEKPAKAKAAAKGASGRQGASWLSGFIAHFLRADVYKPTQGWNARMLTALGLALLIGAGLWRLFVTQLQGETAIAVQFGLPLALAAFFAWTIFRLIQYPPFVDFLAATEAEMNKVSWTSWAELKRATAVVLTTVLLMSLYLFGVDWLWTMLLQTLGILRFASGDFGSQVG